MITSRQLALVAHRIVCHFLWCLSAQRALGDRRSKRPACGLRQLRDRLEQLVPSRLIVGNEYLDRRCSNTGPNRLPSNQIAERARENAETDNGARLQRPLKCFISDHVSLNSLR